MLREKSKYTCQHNRSLGSPGVTADYLYNGEGPKNNGYKTSTASFGTTLRPDNRWTNSQSFTPYNVLNYSLPRARKISSLSLAVMDEIARGGHLACPAYLSIIDRAGNMVAKRDP